MPTTRQCAECGTPLPDDVPEGACPVCALRGALELPDVSFQAAVTEKPGDRIGHFKLLEKIGEGGCGIVYMAEQTEPIRRRVALKIVKLGMDTRQVIARFEAERQAVALMDHPNIAKVLDAGATDTGRPYFVMELVRGIKITDFCDQHNLSTRERLELFRQVCHAVQHAHQKGIIHRDIKPSNVLVTELDGAPVPKVIDFGIAKATSQQLLTDKTLFTAFQQFVGTPAYMSPEQAGMSGADIDTRSDIYALGVLLYELLTGHMPFECNELLRDGFDEMRRLIREQEPPMPSTRLGTLAQGALNAVARSRQTEPPRLLHLVRGDLDWIVMKCLEKDRGRRYETASGLARDVLRHLSNEPVEARPPGSLYRLQKLVRRNKLAFGAGSAVALALLAALVISTWMFLKEREARQVLEARAYISDMGQAMRTASMRVGLGGVVKLLDAWRDHKPDLRGWEWHYLNGLCRQDLLTIRADSNELWSVTWNPDGRRLATGGTDGDVKIWDALSGHEITRLRDHTGEVMSVAWNPDGRRLASASKDKTVKVWDLENGGKPSTLRGHLREVTCLTWSPDGGKLASGSADRTVRIWDPVSGVSTQRLSAESTVLSLSWTRNGKRLAACGMGGPLKVWDLDSGKELWGPTLSGGNSTRCSVAWSPDDTRLAIGGDDLTVSIRDAASGTSVSTYWGYNNSILSVAWDPRGVRLASATRGDGTIKVWEAVSGQGAHYFRGHLGSVRCVCWRPDGSQLASAGADGTVKVWDANKKDSSVTTLQQPDQVVCVAWHPDGKKLATGGRRSSAWIWDLAQAGGPVVLPGPAEWTWTVAWNPAGTRLASAGSDGVLRVWEPVSATEVWHVQAASTSIRAIAWSPDSRHLASVGHTRQLKIWEAGAGKLLSTFALRNQVSYAVAWSPEGRSVAIGAQYGIQILDAATGAEQRFLTGHKDAVKSLAWSPDGKRLASASDDASVKIWDKGNGSELQTLLGHAAPVYSVTWSPDGTRLATGSWDKTSRLWDPANGMEIGSLGEHVSMVHSVAWSADGTRIASADMEGEIRIYDSVPGHSARAFVSPQETSGRSGRAVTDTIRSLKLYCATAEAEALKDDADALRRVAWILATSRYAELRDGPKAVVYAEKAIAVTSRKNAGLLAILAAAYAEAGNFPGAIGAQKEAIALLSSEERKKEFTSELKLYESHLPCRDDSW